MSSPPPSPPPSRGSLGLGIALAWACLIGGYVLAFGLAGAIPQGVRSEVGPYVLLGLLPWLLMIGLIIFYVINNQPRTAGGIGLGMLSILALILLLVAACFGIFAGK